MELSANNGQEVIYFNDKPIGKIGSSYYLYKSLELRDLKLVNSQKYKVDKYWRNMQIANSDIKLDIDDMYTVDEDYDGMVKLVIDKRYRSICKPVIDGKPVYNIKI
ncbi:hypothetical protein [Zooshikella harenae]|uniref:Uncharacterized protein n=1 Tax=Zooshikella harenae TaxID=2827238 RepID=A0ABS5ZFX3_9GAMM|nr:hypothetical protein [Zooshikella harenae]MBU2712971.1 hypothetical protein [Zooshikella harenae]